MDDSWTDSEQVKAGFQEARFKDVALVTEKWSWTWVNSDEFIKYLMAAIRAIRGTLTLGKRWAGALMK